MSLVKSYSKANDTTYVYEQDMKWDNDLKRPVGTRKLVGKIDPETGDIIPTGRRGRKKTKADNEVTMDKELLKLNEDLSSENKQLKEKIFILHSQNDELKRTNASYKKRLDKIASIIND